MNPSLSLIRCAGALLLGVSALAASSAAADLSAPPFPTHAVVDPVAPGSALATKTVTCLLQDRRGALHVGTQAGLFRWDGALLEPEGSGALPGAYVHALLEEPDGALLVALESRLLRRSAEPSAGRFEEVRLPPPAAAIRSSSQPIARSGGSLLVATDRGVAVRTGSAWGLVAGTEDARLVYVDPSGGLWCAGPSALRRLVPAESGGAVAESFPLDEAPVGLAVSDGSLFVRTQRRLLRLDRTAGGVVPDPHPLPPASDFGVLTTDRAGRLLAPSGLGLHVREPGGTWRSWTRKNGLSGDAVFTALEDSDGALLLGYGGAGVDRWANPRSVAAVTEAEGLPNDVVWAATRDRAGSLVVGTNDGIAVWEGKSWRTVSESDGLPGRVVRDLAAAGDGSIWSLSIPGGLARLDERLHPTPVPLEVSAFGFAVAPDGRVLVATRGGLFRSLPGSAGLEPYPEPLAGRSVAISPAPDGSFWTSGREGLARIGADGVRRLGAADGLPAGGALLVAAVSGEEAFVAFRNAAGVARVVLAGGGVTVEPVPLPDAFDHPFLMAIDRGRLFVGSDSGIAIRSRDGSVRVIDRSDGFVWNDCSAGAFFADSGGVHVGTSRGLAILAPDGIAEEPPVRADVRPVPAPAGAPKRPRGELRVRLGASTFRPAQVTFRYRVVGLDDDWQETTQRELRFAALPAGRFRVEVVALSEDGRPGPVATTAEIEVPPPFWATWKFRIAAALLLAAISWGFYRLRVRALLRSKARLSALVSERTSDLSARATELSAANLRLEEAQRTIGRLQKELAPGEDLGSRAATGAGEVARLLGCEAISIWTLDAGRVERLVAGPGGEPTLEEVLHGAESAEGEPRRSVAPFHALSGESLGALVLPVRLSVAPTTDQRLVDGLARQMASTLELARLRRRLIDSEDERRRSLALLAEDGVERAGECPICLAIRPAKEERCPADGAGLVTGRFAPYRVAGRYRLEKRLGEGGMGAVFEAEDERLSRRVALKLIREDAVRDPLLRIRLEREAHAVARIRHPGVVAVHDFGATGDGAAWLVMELLDGSDYAALLRRFGRGSAREVAGVATEAGAALAAAHAAGLVHRDLKPANLFRVRSGSGFATKVVDFGLARPMGGRTDASISGVVVGSPAYMSPEQIREGRLDGRSDLFSLASVLYELLTGSVPFPAPSVSETLARILLEEPVPPSRMIPGADGILDRAFEQAFRKDPEERAGDVVEWTGHLVRVLSRLPDEPPIWTEAIGAPGSESPTLFTR